MAKIRDEGFLKTTKASAILNNGRKTPFINVTFSGLLWGYNDELPCFTKSRPNECGVDDGALDLFETDEDEEDEDWDDWKRKKREVRDRQKRSAEEGDDLRTLDHDKITKEKAAFVDCKCEWGLFRDRNVTLRKPVTINHGMTDLSKKGWVSKFDSSPVLNWWKAGSECDKVGGQDGGTLYPGTKKTDNLEMFISLMCRKINLQYENDTDHLGLQSYRFIASPNALGSHDDPDTSKKNSANACYCLAEENFECFKSGVLNLAPCKKTESLPQGAPIAVSFPHFYQADPSFLEAIESGLAPEKDKHQFYVDISPQFGFPLAIRPRFQLNLIIKRDPDISIMRSVVSGETLLTPFLNVSLE